MTIEEYIAGVHARLDKLSELSLTDKLKGHLLLRQAGMDSNTRNVIIGSASGCYEVAKISAALRQAFRESLHPSHNTFTPGSCKGRQRGRKKDAKIRGHQGQTNREFISQKEERNSYGDSCNLGRSIFLRTILQMWRKYLVQLLTLLLVQYLCSGQETLDKAVKQLVIFELPDAQAKQLRHRFGDTDQEILTACAVLFPFQSKGKNGEHITFQVHFDVVPGKLPFLVGWPSLCAMKANINCEYVNIGIKVDGKYTHIPLKSCDYHAYLPFRPENRYQIHKQRGYYTYYPPRMVYPSSDAASKITSTAKTYSLANSKKENHYPVTSTTEKEISKTFDTTKLKKLHLALGHGTATATEDWLKTAGLWYPELKKSISELLLECPCKVAKESKPHPVVSTDIPELNKQLAVSVDILFLEGVPVMHAVDKCIGCSETSVLRNRSHDE